MKSRALVVGFGNTCLGDDGIGLYLLRDICNRFTNGQFDFLECNEYGMYLIDKLEGYGTVILIDAFSNPELPPGNISTWSEQNFSQSFRGASPHYIGITDVVRLGMWYGLEMPEKITFFGVNIHSFHEFSDSLSDPLKASYPAILTKLHQFLETSF